MDMKKEVHVSAKDLMAMVRMEPGRVGTYTIVPGPRERLQSIVEKLEHPARTFPTWNIPCIPAFIRARR